MIRCLTLLLAVVLSASCQDLQEEPPSVGAESPIRAIEYRRNRLGASGRKVAGR